MQQEYIQEGQRMAPDRSKKDFFSGMNDLGGEERNNRRRIDVDRVMDASMMVML